MDLTMLLMVLAAGMPWIPRRQEDFVALCYVWLEDLEDEAKVAAFGWDKPTVMTLRAAIRGFLAAWEAYLDVNSSYNRIKKDEMMDVAIHDMEKFAATSVRNNDKMSEADKHRLNVHTADTTGTPVPRPKSYPEASADTSVLRQIIIRYIDSVTKRRGKAYGIHGAEIRWQLLDHAPSSVEELIHSDFCTASPFTLTFDESDRGKRLYFALRWETTSNLKGPYSVIYMVVIP